MARSVRWHISLLCFVFCCSLTVAAKGTPDVNCWMEVSTGRKVLYVGDSCVVSYQLFSDVPFSKVTWPDATDLKIKHGTMRPVGRGNDYGTYRVRRNNKIYYTAVVAQYMVAVTEVGKCQLPDWEFVVSFYYNNTPDDDLFSQFFGRRQVQTFQKNVKVKSYTLEVTKKPRRSTSEMLKSGSVV